MSRRSIRRFFHKIGHAIKHAGVKVARFIVNHKKIFLGITVAALSFVPGVGGMMSKGLSTLTSYVKTNPGTVAKLAIAGAGTYGAIKGGSVLAHTVSQYKFPLLIGVAEILGYKFLKK